MSDDRKKASMKQSRLLVTAMENDPSLMIGRTNSMKCRIEYTEKWAHLAETLNAVENGVYKDTNKWQQTWRDLKSNTKKKALKVWKGKSENDQSTVGLNSFEMRVLNLFDPETDLKYLGGIDISTITEVDPLSSDEDGDNNELKTLIYAMDVSNECELNSTNGDFIKVEGTMHGKRPNLDDPVSDDIKRNRRNFNRDAAESSSQDVTGIAQRLTALEQAQAMSEHRYTTFLEATVKAIEKQGSAAEKQAEATEIQTRTLEKLSNFLHKGLNKDAAQDDPGIAQRLTALEQAQAVSERHYTTLLETTVKAMEKQASAAVRQAEATEIQTRTLDKLSNLLHKGLNKGAD